MSHRQFAGLVAALKALQDDFGPTAYRLLCARISTEIRVFDHRFDRAAFLKMCGVWPHP